MSRSIKVVGFAALLAAGQASFVGAVEVGKGAAQPARQANSVQAPARVEPSAKLIEGVVTQLDIARGKVEIQGQWHSIAWGRTQIFQNGHSVRPDALKVGQAVSYSSAEGAAGTKQLGLVYVR